MMLMLAWLTVSAPFVNAGQQQRAKLEKKASNTSPLAGSEEEKVPTSPSPNAPNEYLHECEELQHSFVETIFTYSTLQLSLYIAFHGELVSPPPEA